MDAKDQTNYVLINTRPFNQGDELSVALRELGYEVIELPALTVLPLTSALESVASELLNITSNPLLVFTSRNAVSILSDYLEAKGKDSRELLQGRECAVIGEKTALLARDAGLDVVFTSKESNSKAFSEELLEFLVRMDNWPTVVALLRGHLANKDFARRLEEAQVPVVDITLYETRRRKLSTEEFERISELTSSSGTVVEFLFTSSEAVRMIVENFSELLRFLQAEERLSASVIGPETAKTALEFGFPIRIQAENTSIEALLRCYR